jgi:hypothetical protein
LCEHRPNIGRESIENPPRVTALDADSTSRPGRVAVSVKPSTVLFLPNAAWWNGMSESNDVASALPDGSLDETGSVLVAGPSKDVLRGVPTGLLDRAASDGDGVVAVTTDLEPRTLVDRIERRVSGVARDDVAIVDARPHGDAVRANPRPLHWRLRSPMDLTGTSQAVHECLSTLFDRGVSTRHVVFDSLSRLVLGGDVETVARFTHQLLVLADAPDALGVYPTYTNTTDEGDLAQLAHLFGGRVDVRRSGDRRELRCRGIAGASGEWTAIESTMPDRIGDVRVR